MKYFVTEKDAVGFRAAVNECLDGMSKDGHEEFGPYSAIRSYGAILCAGIIGCVDPEAIAEGLEYDIDFVNEVVSRLRMNGIWDHESYVKLHHHIMDVEDEQHAGISFYIHLSVAQGHVKSEDGEHFAITETGKRYVEDE